MSFTFDVVNREGCTEYPEGPYLDDVDSVLAWAAYYKLSFKERGRYESGSGWTVRLKKNMWPILDKTPHPEPLPLDGPEWEAVRAARSPKPHHIFAYKFESNDGWLVTPEECRDINYLLHSHPDEHVRQFAKFCLFAKERGGFEVW